MLDNDVYRRGNVVLHVCFGGSACDFCIFFDVFLSMCNAFILRTRPSVRAERMAEAAPERMGYLVPCLERWIEGAVCCVTLGKGG